MTRTIVVLLVLGLAAMALTSASPTFFGFIQAHMSSIADPVLFDASNPGTYLKRGTGSREVSFYTTYRTAILPGSTRRALVVGSAPDSAWLDFYSIDEMRLARTVNITGTRQGPSHWAIDTNGDSVQLVGIFVAGNAYAVSRVDLSTGRLMTLFWLPSTVSIIPGATFYVQKSRSYFVAVRLFNNAKINCVYLRYHLQRGLLGNVSFPCENEMRSVQYEEEIGAVVGINANSLVVDAFYPITGKYRHLFNLTGAQKGDFVGRSATSSPSSYYLQTGTVFNKRLVRIQFNLGSFSQDVLGTFPDGDPVVAFASLL